MTELFFKFSHRDTGSAVVFEDDGRVAYAYWLNEDGRIVGDIWLYNRCETPSEPEWTDREGAPYANPLPYAKECLVFQMPESASDVRVEWLDNGARAKIILSGEVAVLLEPGAKPGWAAMAAKDGPLAKRLGVGLDHASEV
jgi:hypothetical protein